MKAYIYRKGRDGRLMRCTCFHSYGWPKDLEIQDPVEGWMKTPNINRHIQSERGVK
jgi:hypothetical protein